MEDVDRIETIPAKMQLAKLLIYFLFFYLILKYIPSGNLNIQDIISIVCICVIMVAISDMYIPFVRVIKI